jgi:general secretion pathway protein D
MYTISPNQTVQILRRLWCAGLASLAIPTLVAQEPPPPIPPPMPARSSPLAGVVRPNLAGTTNAAGARGRPALQPALNAEVVGDAEAKAPELKFESSPSDIVLQTFARETGRTLLIAPDAPKATISLRSQTPLNRREYLQAIQTVLRMNNIALLPVGDKFLKVVPASTVLANAIETDFQDPEGGPREDHGEIISQMVQLRYISIDEASKAIAPFKRGEGQVQIFERTNSILLTDRTENVNRMMEIIRFLDQPRAVREEVNVRPIKYAKAANIKQRLEEIVAESQKATAGKATPQAAGSGAPGIRSVAPLPVPAPVPGVIRAGMPTLATSSTPVNNPIVEALMAEAERGVIRGKVQILADERTNMLLLITQPENMKFFDRIINVLDIETTPDFQVSVLRLEYADAEEIAKLLNDLIGNVKAEQPKGMAGATTGGAAAGTAGESKGAEPARSATLADFAERMRTPAAAAAEPGKSKVGELSKDNIKILANKRTNAVILQASKSDTAAIRDIIRDMDIMLSQVLIETVVLDVSLNSSMETGIDWVQRMAKTGKLGGDMNPLYYAGGGGGGSGVNPVNLLATGVTNLTSSGLQYFFSMPNLGVDAVIKASAADGRAKVLSSPVLLTQDNKEATIEATQLRYLFKGYTYLNSASGYSSGDKQANVDQRNVGLTVKVTPRINIKGMVSLKVDETFEDIGPDQEIDGQKWPTTQTRKLSADIAVKSGETVILGGLVRNEKKNSSTKIPLLGDIPFIGQYLFGSTSATEARSELLVFLTPYVLDTPDSMAAEARRRKDYLDVKGMWTKGWSDSKLAEETIRQKMKREQAEHAAERAREKSAKEQAEAATTDAPRVNVFASSVTTNVFVGDTNAVPATARETK